MHLSLSRFWAFLELKSIYNKYGDQELIPFNNTEIQIGGKTVFYQDWFDQGVYSISDIVDSSGKYLNFADFCRKFSLSPIFLPIFKFCRLSPNDCWKRRGSLAAPIQFLLREIPLLTCHRRCRSTFLNWHAKITTGLFWTGRNLAQLVLASGNATFLTEFTLS